MLTNTLIEQSITVRIIESLVNRCSDNQGFTVDRLFNKRITNSTIHKLIDNHNENNHIRHNLLLEIGEVTYSGSKELHGPQS